MKWYDVHKFWRKLSATTSLNIYISNISICNNYWGLDIACQFQIYKFGFYWVFSLLFIYIQFSWYWEISLLITCNLAGDTLVRILLTLLRLVPHLQRATGEYREIFRWLPLVTPHSWLGPRWLDKELVSSSASEVIFIWYKVTFAS